MFRNCTVFSLIFIVAMNSLLASAGGAVLCLHDHSYGHVLAGPHSDESEDCHDDQSHEHEADKHEPVSEFMAESGSHCVDIIVSASDEPVHRFLDTYSPKKVFVADVSYSQFSSHNSVRNVPQIRLSTRAPPAFCSALDQCVRKTVLRI